MQTTKRENTEDVRHSHIIAENICKIYRNNFLSFFYETLQQLQLIVEKEENSLEEWQAVGTYLDMCKIRHEKHIKYLHRLKELQNEEQTHGFE